jgi:cytochrome P450
MADRQTTHGRLPTVGGLTTVVPVEQPGGTMVMVPNGAAHRGPRRSDDPSTFELALSNVRRSRATRFTVEQRHG